MMPPPPPAEKEKAVPPAPPMPPPAHLMGAASDSSPVLQLTGFLSERKGHSDNAQKRAASESNMQGSPRRGRSEASSVTRGRIASQGISTYQRKAHPKEARTEFVWTGMSQSPKAGSPTFDNGVLMRGSAAQQTREDNADRMWNNQNREYYQRSHGSRDDNWNRSDERSRSGRDQRNYDTERYNSGYYNSSSSSSWKENHWY